MTVQSTKYSRQKFAEIVEFWQAMDTMNPDMDIEEAIEVICQALNVTDKDISDALHESMGRITP